MARTLLAPCGLIRPGFSWGRYPSGGWHPALDFPSPMNTPIRSGEAGTVEFAGYDSGAYRGGFGYHVRVRFNFGHYGIYAHMSRMAVRRGQKVKRGQVIGYGGTSGNSTGPHTHMEVRTKLYVQSTSYNFTNMLRYSTSGTSSSTAPRIDVSTIRPGARNASVAAYNRLLWIKAKSTLGDSYRSKNHKAWMSESASHYGPAAQKVTYDLYAWLYRQAPRNWGKPPSKPAWPGPALVSYIGGRPV